MFIRLCPFLFTSFARSSSVLLFLQCHCCGWISSVCSVRVLRVWSPARWHWEPVAPLRGRPWCGVSGSRGHCPQKEEAALCRESSLQDSAPDWPESHHMISPSAHIPALVIPVLHDNQMGLPSVGLSASGTVS